MIARRANKTAGWLAAAGMVAAAVWLIVSGIQGSRVESLPLPSEPFSVSAEEATARVGDLVRPEQPFSSVTIPALSDAAHPITPSSSFTSSEYDNFEGLVIPDDPTQVAWYGHGGAITGGSEGTTLLASHIAVKGTQGAFWGVEALKPGDLVWTRGPSGESQAWAVTQVWSALHTEFPQEYFAAAGPRQLVLATCGGELNEFGYYQYNIFVVATPVG